MKFSASESSATSKSQPVPRHFQLIRSRVKSVSCMNSPHFGHRSPGSHSGCSDCKTSLPDNTPQPSRWLLTSHARVTERTRMSTLTRGYPASYIAALDTGRRRIKNRHVAAPTANGFGDPIITGGRHSRAAAFFTSVHHSFAFVMVGRGGEAFGPAGSSVPVRQPRHVPAAPRLATDRQASTHTGGLHA